MKPPVHAAKLQTGIAEVWQQTPWPEPTVDEPDLETLVEWMDEGVCEATDGCIVEPDGYCAHAHPSWLLKLGWI